MSRTESRLEEVNYYLDSIKAQHPHHPQLLQAATDILESSMDVLVAERRDLLNEGFLERLMMPDRIIQFTVHWRDDSGRLHINRAARVQHSNLLGPYKGGLRFHPQVNLDTLQFLALEQTLKNSLTGMQLGGAKGGSDFNPRNRSNQEIGRFCHALMTELAHHIGPNRDVPAGDIGVGEREIGYLFGRYREMSQQFAGVLTGKTPFYGGSCLRQEATGYGCVYVADQVLDGGVEGRTCLVSGAGNVALHTAEKLIALGARVLTLSDSEGFALCKDGIDKDQLEEIKQRRSDGERLSAMADDCGFKYHKGSKPWEQEGELAFPSATQNELDGDDAKSLANNGLKALFEGANMPLTADARDHLVDKDILLVPSIAANAGGVAVSSLEMSQNTMGQHWSADEVDEKLQAVMKDIVTSCKAWGESKNKVDYIKGANVAGLIRVLDAAAAQWV